MTEADVNDNVIFNIENCDGHMMAKQTSSNHKEKSDSLFTIYFTLCLQVSGL